MTRHLERKANNTMGLTQSLRKKNHVSRGKGKDMSMCGNGQKGWEG